MINLHWVSETPSLELGFWINWQQYTFSSFLTYAIFLTWAVQSFQSNEEFSEWTLRIKPFGDVLDKTGRKIFFFFFTNEIFIASNILLSHLVRSNMTSGIWFCVIIVVVVLFYLICYCSVANSCLTLFWPQGV